MSRLSDDIDLFAIKGITADSRQVKAGYLFAAIPGTQADGRDYIGAAIEAGASYILAPERTKVEGAERIESDNVRRDLALLAARYYGDQPETIVAVTGTNGKTSVADFTRQLWQALGVRAASIGTLGVLGINGDPVEGVELSGATTPDPVGLMQVLARLSAQDYTHLAIEASSHGLDQHRLDGVRVDAAAFTNLTQDHLDYHGTMEAYQKAKMRLFSNLLIDCGFAVLNANDPAVHEMAEKIERDVMFYGDKDITLKLFAPHPQGIKFEIEFEGLSYTVDLPLVGEFQVMNALCALGLVVAEGRWQTSEIVPHLSNLKGVAGRMQRVPDETLAVYVDYAHTPDALKTVLKALRPHTEKRLVCVFGCGGDRDKGKRPMMGEIARMHADHVIVTDDNPRSEDPAAIRAEILAAAAGAEEIGDRRKAIQHAIQNLQEGDVLVIAGKGHEQGQVLKNSTEPFDDFKEAHAALQQYQKEKKPA